MESKIYPAVNLGVSAVSVSAASNVTIVSARDDYPALPADRGGSLGGSAYVFQNYLGHLHFLHTSSLEILIHVSDSLTHSLTQLTQLNHSLIH